MDKKIPNARRKIKKTVKIRLGTSPQTSMLAKNLLKTTITFITNLITFI